MSILRFGLGLYGGLIESARLPVQWKGQLCPRGEAAPQVGGPPLSHWTRAPTLHLLIPC